MDSLQYLKLVSYTIIVGTLSYRFINHWNSAKIAKKDLESNDSIKLEALKELITCNVPTIKSSAIQIVFDRATTPTFVQYILKSMKHPDVQKQRDAIITLHTILSYLKPQIVNKFKIMKQTVRFLYKTQDETLVTYALMIIYAIVKDSDKRKAKLAGYKIISYLINATNVNPKKCGSKIYWIIMVFYQFSLSDSIVPMLVNNHVPKLLLELTKRKYGAVTAQKYCIHALVRIISVTNDSEAKIILNELYHNGCFEVISSSLRNSDHELSSWGIFLLHDFALHGVMIEPICAIKGLIKFLAPHIRPNDPVVPRVILRMLKTICERKTDFYKEIEKYDIIQRATNILASAEEQTQFWALALVNTILYQCKLN